MIVSMPSPSLKEPWDALPCLRHSNLAAFVTQGAARILHLHTWSRSVRVRPARRAKALLSMSTTTTAEERVGEQGGTTCMPCRKCDRLPATRLFRPLTGKDGQRDGRVFLPHSRAMAFRPLRTSRGTGHLAEMQLAASSRPSSVKVADRQRRGRASDSPTRKPETHLS